MTAMQTDSAAPERCAALTGSAGPRYCAICGEWPAMETPLGLRCHLCECRDYAAAHPVPLPNNPDMLRDLASIGVPGAAEKLRQRARRSQQRRAADSG